MTGGHALGQFLQGTVTFTRRHPAPSFDEFSDLTRVCDSLAAVGGNLRILHGLRGPVPLAGLVAIGFAVGAFAIIGIAVAATGARLLLLGLVFEFLDDLVKASDDFLLELLRLRTAAGQIETPLDVLHLASDG